MTAPVSLTIEEPGFLTTVQDLGRWGAQHYGVSVSGAMDRVSLRVANRLVGNREGFAGLEVTMSGPTILFNTESQVAVSGADFVIYLDDYPVSSDTLLLVGRGQRLSFKRRLSGARAYIAVAGGLEVESVLGSSSTHLPSKRGGLAGRPLQRGDELRIGTYRGESVRPSSNLRWGRRFTGGTKVRLILGPQADWFSWESIETLCSETYRVGISSDRMGYRMEGAEVHRYVQREMLSQAISFGSIQVPQSGKLIVAMADCQTIGGYPKIATVISADLHLLGQLGPGDWLEFDVCDRPAARQALFDLESMVMSF